MAQDADRELARLWRVSRTAHEMVRDRGYEVAQYEIDVTFDEFRMQHSATGLQFERASMHFTADIRTADAINRIYVFFCPDKAVSKASIKTFVTAMEGQRASKGIMIYAEKLSSVAARTIQELAQEYHLEAFKEGELLVNITRHFLVPKHSIMRPEEKQALIKKYRLKETQLPRIMLNDPVARYYGVKRGQVMKIERASETAGRYITYRICM